MDVKVNHYCTSWKWCAGTILFHDGISSAPAIIISLPTHPATNHTRTTTTIRQRQRQVTHCLSHVAAQPLLLSISIFNSLHTYLCSFHVSRLNPSHRPALITSSAPSPPTFLLPPLDSLARLHQNCPDNPRQLSAAPRCNGAFASFDHRDRAIPSLRPALLPILNGLLHSTEQSFTCGATSQTANQEPYTPAHRPTA